MNHKIEQRTSIGTILYTMIDNEVMYLLVEASSKKYWEFPKGKKERGESDSDTLSRELKEEVGIANFEIIPAFSFSYIIDTNTQKRKIIYYLARFDEQKITISDEHNDFRLCSYDEARRILIIPKLREALERAQDRIICLGLRRCI